MWAQTTWVFSTDAETTGQYETAGRRLGSAVGVERAICCLCQKRWSFQENGGHVQCVARIGDGAEMRNGRKGKVAWPPSEQPRRAPRVLSHLWPQLEAHEDSGLALHFPRRRRRLARDDAAGPPNPFLFPAVVCDEASFAALWRAAAIILHGILPAVLREHRRCDSSHPAREHVHLQTLRTVILSKRTGEEKTDGLDPCRSKGSGISSNRVYYVDPRALDHTNRYRQPISFLPVDSP